MSIAVFLMVMSSGCSNKKDRLKQIENFFEEMDAQAEFVSVEGVPVARKVRFIQEEEMLLPDSLELKQIALIRHGEPALEKEGRFSYEEAKQYMKNYDSVGILIPDEPFFQVGEEEEILFYVSNLNRAKTTADYLFGPEQERVESTEFREFERSLGKRRAPIRLPLRYWTVTARIEWILGINREGIESFGAAKERAEKAAEKLNSQSREHDKIAVVAHGFLNRYLKKYLKDRGWHIVREGGLSYFGTTILVKMEETGREELITEVNQ